MDRSDRGKLIAHRLYLTARTLLLVFALAVTLVGAVIYFHDAAVLKDLRACVAKEMSHAQPEPSVYHNPKTGEVWVDGRTYLHGMSSAVGEGPNSSEISEHQVPEKLCSEDLGVPA